MITKGELERGICATEARLAEVRNTPLAIRALEEARAEQTARERERAFRNLTGCWADDSGDDDVEALLRNGRASRPGNRSVPAFGGRILDPRLDPKRIESSLRTPKP